MPKPKIQYECSACGAVQAKWSGRCQSCGTWDSLTERAAPAPKAPGARSAAAPGAGGARPRPLAAVLNGGPEPPRVRTGISELDSILGGGLVPGSLLLIGGDPGIGKSTLMLQAAGRLAESGVRVLYLSGEESEGQIGMRARRLGIKAPEELLLLTETCFETVESAIREVQPQVLVVDSIQTIYVGAVEGIPGSIVQVREASAGFMRLAKQDGLTVILVGHVTKEGALAGPRILEHMVDTVLYFEGDGNWSHRILRVVKNRFGSTNEIGVFEMRGDGLAEVTDLSGYFLDGRAAESPGTAVVCTVEGTRPLLVEVQALVTPTGYGTAQRVSTGYDSKRLAIMLAILEKRLGLPLSSQDVFLNMAGGLRVLEPAVDLGVCMGLCSSLRERAVDRSTAFIGEVGLGGELRRVSYIENRLRETAKLGFSRVVCAAAGLEKIKPPRGLTLSGCESLEDAVRTVFAVRREGGSAG